MTPKPLLAFLTLAALTTAASAADLTNGLMSAVPTKSGRPPVIDGDLKDFDFSAAEPIWLSPQNVEKYNANIALMYDDDALYFGAEVALPNRGIHNPNNPTDAFWWGDVLELRLAADPTLPAPLTANVNSDRVAHITMWKNSETGQDFLNIGYGVNIEKGAKLGPAGSSLVIKPGTNSYTVEARLPWSAFNVPGGKNPFKPGEKMTAVLSPHWGGEAQTPALYRTNPGFFAFQQPQTWGQVQFSAAGNLKPRHDTMAQVVTRLVAERSRKPAPVGVPFTVNVPASTKVSVNIFGPNGEVIRELMGGEAQPAGKLTLHWDGKDQWGQGVAPGAYKWGAYFSNGLKAQFMGGVGKSGQIYYETPDGKGGWGGDHSNPIDVAADVSGLYFLWPVSESGRAIVKTDYNGKILWRKTPFVGGGFGPFYAIATDGKFVYLTLGTDKVRLVRLDAGTGTLQTWESGGTEMSVDEAPLVHVSRLGSMEESPNAASFGHKSASQPNSTGLATNGREVFFPVYAKNLIRVLDAATGKPIRELACPGPRGLALNAAGDLLAVSYVEDGDKATARIVRFAAANGTAVPVISQGLLAPWDVATAADGRLFVSDLGTAQQVKVFDATGKPLQTFGKAGGRPWQGKYESTAFLRPSGLAIDAQGALLVTESAIPKVFSRLDASTGKVLKQWFGAPVYWTSTWPSIDDPREVFAPLTGGIARFKLPQKGDQDRPEAYWALNEAGYPHAATFETGYVHPDWVRAKNGKDYLVSDGRPFTVALKEGDLLRPIVGLRRIEANDKTNASGKVKLEMWADANGDGQMSPAETVVIDTVAGAPIVTIADWTDAMHMEPNGDLYFMTMQNRILKIPALGFALNGTIKWDVKAASYPVNPVIPSLKDWLPTSWVIGLHGARLDQKRNLYTIVNTNVAGNGKPFEYATPEMAKRLKEGMGHTSEYNVVKFAKFNAQGKMVWIAGRKATAAPKAGEMLHFWNMAGLVNERYIAGGSEWGQIYFYTADGFFVDALMENPGLNPAPGPYTFGGETSGGRVQYFPKQDELWAYSSGMAYQVEGFSKGRVEGEARTAGTVKLDRVYESADAVKAGAPPVQLAATANDPFTPGPTGEAAWNGIPVSTLTKGDDTLATAQLGYDAKYLYAKIRVTDSTPLQNAADTLATAFKGGDTAGLVIGPSGARKQPFVGDVRFIAAQIGGTPRLIAMKSVTAGARRPETYVTPAGGEAKFEFVGEVPGARVSLVPDATGYTALFAVPRAFLEFDIAAGKELSGDIEIRLSGNGQRGLQATSRNYLFTPPTSETTMTDDIPTEARMYPAGWGKIEVK